MNGFKKPEELRIVKSSEGLADRIWDEVIKWNYFAKDTVGKQLVKAVDSIGANIIEAEGRYHIKEEIHFLYISRASLWETKYWLRRAEKRNLIKQEKYREFIEIAENLSPQLNSFITHKRKKNV